MIKFVKEMYYKEMHYIKWRDDETNAYGIAIYRAFVNHAGMEDWQPIENVPCDKKASLERVKEQLWMLYHDAPVKLPVDMVSPSARDLIRQHRYEDSEI